MSEFEEIEAQMASDQQQVAQLRVEFAALQERIAAHPPTHDFREATEGKNLRSQIEDLEERLRLNRLRIADHIGNR